MITTVTLNPCIDRSVYVPSLHVGGHNRAVRSRTDLGGKGINVSVELRTMGYDTQALCLDAVDSGTFLSDGLTAVGIKGILVTAPGRLRENLKLYDMTTDEMTEVNEPGAWVDQSTLKRMTQKLDALLSSTDVLVLSGSVPPGAPDDLYYKLIMRAKEKKVYTVLDAAGPLLREGIKACPDLIKPNRFELETLCGRTFATLGDARAQAREMVCAGIGSVCLSLGASGALLITAHGEWYSSALSLDIKGIQGAGDSMVAGLCLGHTEGWDGARTLACATALAQGSLMREGTLLCTRALYDDILPKISVTDAMDDLMPLD